MTLSTLAEKTGTTPQTIQRLETSNMTISVEWIEKIALALQIAPSILFVSNSPTVKVRHLNEWQPSMGAKLWWRQFPVVGLPYVGTPEDLGLPVELSGPNGKSVRMYVGGFPQDAMSFTDIPFPGVLK